ncbi:hypothetical protein ACR9GP_25305 [Enterobacter ludwigii]
MKLMPVWVLLGTFITGSSAIGCSLPDTLIGESIMAENVQPYSPENPMAGDVYLMKFGKDGKYSYVTLKDNKTYEGEYAYKKLSAGVSVITATSTYSDDTVKYSMTMVCSNNYYGSYNYQQSIGVGGERTNISRYFILQRDGHLN